MFGDEAMCETDPVADLRSKSVLLATEVAAMLPKGETNFTIIFFIDKNIFII